MKSPFSKYALEMNIEPASNPVHLFQSHDGIEVGYFFRGHSEAGFEMPKSDDPCGRHHCYCFHMEYCRLCNVVADQIDEAGSIHAADPGTKQALGTAVATARNRSLSWNLVAIRSTSSHFDSQTQLQGCH